MGTTLRLSFAMGGGVSLGAFSGAALSEALKLLLMYGKDASGQPYGDVVVDSFSGASAGALSLAVMLRVLASPPGGAERVAAIATLTDQFGGEFTALARTDPHRYGQLIAAQLLQDAEKLAWVQEITIDRLLGYTEGGRHDLTSVGSLLDGNAVEAIGRKLMALGNDPISPHPPLLGERVLFACTLANLSPMVADARKAIPSANAGYVGLTNGLRSKVHRDLRVFDIHFRDARPWFSPGAASLPPLPERWCRYHVGDEIGGMIGDLRRPKTWEKITATAIASGSVPFAFEPVILKRDEWEYGKLWPSNLAARGITEHPFAFVDGGTFNNEPIREAFRLAAFLDASAPDPNCERRVLFVDPFVDPEDFPERIPLLAQLGVADGKLRRRSSLERMLPQVSSTLQVIRDEASAVEANKVYLTRQSLDTRDSIRALMPGMLSSAPGDGAFGSLKQFCEGLLVQQRVDDMIPPGALDLPGELERVVHELSLADPTGPWQSLRGRATALYRNPSPASDPHAASWLQALACVAVDLAMGLEGKNDQARLIAIAPFTNMATYATALIQYQASLVQFNAAWQRYRQAVRRNPTNPGCQRPVAPVRPQPKPVDLPGGDVGGFAGFLSREVRDHDFQAGRHCAGEFLSVCAGVQGAGLPILPALLPWTTPGPMADRKAGVARLGERVRALIRGMHLSTWWERLIQPCAANWAEGKAKRALSQSVPLGECYTLIVVLPEAISDMVLGSGLEPTKFDGASAFITVAEHVEGVWTGPHVSKANGGFVLQVAHRPRSLFGAKRRVCTISLPTRSVVETARDLAPNPTIRIDLDAADLGGTTIQLSAAEARWRWWTGV